MCKPTISFADKIKSTKYEYKYYKYKYKYWKYEYKYYNWNYKSYQDVCKTTIFYADKMVERVSREQVNFLHDDNDDSESCGTILLEYYKLNLNNETIFRTTMASSACPSRYAWQSTTLTMCYSTFNLLLRWEYWHIDQCILIYHQEH